ncbi:MAG TPA: heavy metal-binding domain-containing protein, partial [Puia sp.]|nr:heavy metal-binding domain-containing protein [Puia sp.]
MKRYFLNNKYSSSGLIFLRLMFCIMTFISLSSCKHSQTKSASSVAKEDVYYTCSMHPQVHEEHPGKCPICQMDLIAVPKSSMKATNEVHLNEQQIRLGNIQVDTISNGSIGDHMTIPGTLNFNQ